MPDRTRERVIRGSASEEASWEEADGEDCVG